MILIIFSGDLEVCKSIARNLDNIAKSNATFAALYQTIADSNLTISVGSEQDLLNDSHNSRKTLTEFRAYYFPPQIFLFNTRYETIESLTANLLHEMCHAIIGLNSLNKLVVDTLTEDFLIRAGKNITRDRPLCAQENLEDIIKQDDVHDGIPEEQICNSFVKALTGLNFDRAWWRRRIKEVDKANGVSVIID